MSTVTRLVTVVDIDDQRVAGDAPMLGGLAPEGYGPGLAPVLLGPMPDDPRTMSCSALHLAVTDDGRRLVLLADRGWTASGPADIWRHTSVEELESTARTVVGPDEPFGDRSQADMAASHWAYLADVLREQGVVADASALEQLPHDVELSDRIRTRLTRR